MLEKYESLIKVVIQEIDKMFELFFTSDFTLIF